MRPDHDLRRKVIRQWMLLPRSQRRTRAQAEEFAAKILAANTFGPGHNEPRLRVMGWLSSRMAKG